MTEFWNPYTGRGENPFAHFSTWATFIAHYAVPENVIIREKGPGAAVGQGEWYLTHCLNPPTGQEKWYLSYVSRSGDQSKGGRIRYLPLTSSMLRKTPNVGVHWLGGHKDAWTGHCKLHYKVDIEDVRGVHFINWTEDPFEEVKG